VAYIFIESSTGRAAEDFIFLSEPGAYAGMIEYSLLPYLAPIGVLEFGSDQVPNSHYVRDLFAVV
jgi:hypothetical protein